MGSKMWASVVVADGLVCPTACDIFRDQGSKHCSLHCKVDSQPGRDFPGMRQKEREIKLIRMGDAVRTVGQREPTLSGGP